ncbi:MAG: type II toxin-antitoxin system death-on-curing family toxin [Clostridiaceae bacterium]
MAPAQIIFFLDSQDIIAIHERLVKYQEENSRDLLSPENLDMCVSSPNLRMFGIEPYDDPFKKGAKLAFEIVCLHPFMDGNKRTALTSLSTFLEMNGFSLVVPSQVAIHVMVEVAKGSMDYDTFLLFVIEHTIEKNIVL